MHPRYILLYKKHQHFSAVGGETQLSPEVQNKLTMINRRIDQMKNNSATRQTRINESVNRLVE